MFMRQPCFEACRDMLWVMTDLLNTWLHIFALLLLLPPLTLSYTFSCPIWPYSIRGKHFLTFVVFSLIHIFSILVINGQYPNSTVLFCRKNLKKTLLIFVIIYQMYCSKGRSVTDHFSVPDSQWYFKLCSCSTTAKLNNTELLVVTKVVFCCATNTTFEQHVVKSNHTFVD